MAKSKYDYVIALDLPKPGLPKLEKAAEFTDTPQAVTVGSQLTEFTAAVAADVRSAVSNSLLLAQLAANKAAGPGSDVFGWYDHYAEVLQGIGWESQNLEFEDKVTGGKDLDVHKAIIPVIATALGPAAAAASIVLSVLNGLKDMNTDSPWITLFNQKSEHVAGAKFQVTHVDGDAASGDPQLTLLCFAIDAKQTLTQVLFFKFVSQQVALKQSTRRLSVTRDRLNTDKAVIAQRVDAFVADNIQSISL